MERRRVVLYRGVLSGLLKEGVTLYSTNINVNGACTCLITYILVEGCSLLTRKYSPCRRHPIIVSASDVTLRGTVLARCVPFLSQVLRRGKAVRTPVGTIVQGKGRRFIYSRELRRQVITVRRGGGGTLRGRTLLSLGRRCSVSRISGLDKFSEEVIDMPGFYSKSYPGENSYECRRCLRHSESRRVFVRVYGRGCLLTSNCRELRSCHPLLGSCQTLVISRTRGLPSTTGRVFKGDLYCSSVQRVYFCLKGRCRNPRVEGLSKAVQVILSVVKRGREAECKVGRRFRVARRYTVCLCRKVRAVGGVVRGLRGGVPG